MDIMGKFYTERGLYMKNNNSYAYFKESKKDGKVYKNLYIDITLNNGRFVRVLVKQCFYNNKLQYLLENNLDCLSGGDNEKHKQ